ncbi:MAG: C69 family dipeptidase, partial [Candidatus Aminicenantes bacterium]|nr:C69 family dipeptidase [Candidatus Aminicenantes bacterium]
KPPLSPKAGNCVKERLIGAPNTVHTGVIQLRSWLPADIGAVMWAGLAAAPTTVYIPYYFGIEEVPVQYRTAGPKFDKGSAFWIFKTLSILAYPYSNGLIEEVIPVQQGFEKKLFTIQESVEQAALELYKKDKEAARDFLTFYSNGLSLKALNMAEQLSGKLKTKLAIKIH